MSTQTISLTYHLYDGWHRPFSRNTFVITVETRLSAPDLLCKIQEQHRARHNSGDCPQCPGLILVISAWLVDPDALDDHEGSGLLERLQQNANTKLLALDTTLSDNQLQGKHLLVDVTFSASDAAASLATTPLHIPPPKRVLEVEDEFDESPTKRPKLLLPAGIHVIEPATRLILPPLSSTFVSWTKTPGLVFLDKTSCAAQIIRWLAAGSTRLCISSRPGSGKTALLSTVSAWCDCRCPQEARTWLLRLHIGTEAKGNPQDALAKSQGKFLSLIIDLGRQELKLDDRFKAHLNSYLCESLRDFERQYSAELGTQDTPLFAGVATSYVQLLKQIFQRAREKGQQLFVGIDNFDALLLKALTVFDPETLDHIHLHKVQMWLKNFLNFFTLEKNCTLLICSNLPSGYFSDDRILKDISDHPGLRPAFGMTNGEFDDLYSVLNASRTTNRGSASEQHAELGVLTDNSIFDFDTSLYCIAKSHNPAHNDHAKGPSFPLLSEFAALPPLAGLLTYLRRVGEVHITPAVSSSEVPKLSTILSSADTLWHVLYHVGALQKLSRASKPARFTLLISHDFIRTYLFKALPPPSHRPETALERDLRALLSGNPLPLTRALMVHLRNKPFQDLGDMSEACLQTMLDTHITPSYNHFSQLALLTDHTVPAPSESTPKPPAGRGRYGFADSFACDMPDLAPQCAIIGELKCLKLWNLYRPKFGDTVAGEKTWKRKRRIDKNLEELGEELSKLPWKELSKREYWYWDSDNNRLVKTKIGDIYEDAKVQLRCYLNAVVAGNAVDKKVPSARNQSNGIRVGLEKRVIASEGGNDTVIGFVLLAVGQRVYGKAMEPIKTSNTYVSTGYRRAM